jgi:hypothetical protein
MNKPLFILALLGAILVVYGCTKTDDKDMKETEAIDKFVGNFSGTYELWSCGSGGPGQLAFTLENSSLSITKTGPESAEITCNLPVLGQAFKCQATFESDTSLLIVNCLHEDVIYDGVYYLWPNGNKSVNLFDPNIKCRFLGQPVGNVRWAK